MHQLSDPLAVVKKNYISLIVYNVSIELMNWWLVRQVDMVSSIFLDDY